jgi:hypothetical protein
MKLLVSLRFRSSHESVPRVLANFGIGTLQRVPTGVNRDSQMASAERV